MAGGGGQVDAFMKLTGPNGWLKGECKDAMFAEWIEIEDWDLGATGLGTPDSENDGTEAEEDEEEEDEKGKGEGKGKDKKKKPKKKKEGKKGSFTLKITKEPDYTSPDLCQSYSQNLSGDRECFPEIEINCRKSTGTSLVYLSLVFKQAFVVAYYLDLGGGKGSDAGSIGEEKVEFVFETCTIKYTPQTSAGSGGRPIEIGWDFKNQEKL